MTEEPIESLWERNSIEVGGHWATLSKVPSHYCMSPAAELCQDFADRQAYDVDGQQVPLVADPLARVCGTRNSPDHRLPCGEEDEPAETERKGQSRCRA